MTVVTFGEILLRLASPGYTRLLQNSSFDATFCGGEANVAVSLAEFGVESKFVSRVPNGPIGQGAINSLRYFGVQTSEIVRGGDRLGLFYLEKGASQRPSKVIYDRAYSSFANSVLSDFDWKEIFKDAEWFHFTGISPALGVNINDICLEACKNAKELGITISCDLNYRSNLWSPSDAKKSMEKLMEYVDVCIANEEDAENVFGIKAADSDVNMGEINNSSYLEVAKELHDRFNFKYVAITLRTSITANDNNWAGMLFGSADQTSNFSNSYNVHIVDRVGAGDSFGAGLIYGFINDMPLQEIIDFAAASSCLKHSIEGDFNRVTVEEVRNLVNGNRTGRVSR
ncbi:sugar kinase [Trichococcus shcherbakoviae]|uniref:sugar kinase n=1 Tax=Trichococcus shcherbakoviae TaxID=2094020 RepID=UPI0029F5A8B9|nr:sugar kinase [Trichococcus shcherbakoviae]